MHVGPCGLAGQSEQETTCWGAGGRSWAPGRRHPSGDLSHQVTGAECEGTGSPPGLSWNA